MWFRENQYSSLIYRKKEVNSMDGDASSKPKSMYGFVRRVHCMTK